MNCKYCSYKEFHDGNGSYDGVFWFAQGAAGFESLATFEFRVLAWMPLPEPYREE